MIYEFLYNILLNFLLNLKRLIIFKNKLYSNNKSNIKFLSEIYGLIIFKVILYKRLLRIRININSNKPAFYQLFLILFLMTDFSYV